MDAVKYTGNDEANIATSCQNPSRASGGFLVALYSIDGSLVATYPSIEEAARKTGYSPRLINMAVHEKVKRTRKGIFRFI